MSKLVLCRCSGLTTCENSRLQKDSSYIFDSFETSCIKPLTDLYIRRKEHVTSNSLHAKKNKPFSLLVPS